MSRDDVLRKVRTILCEEFGYEDGAYYISEPTLFFEDMGFDAQDVSHLCVKVEERFGVPIPFDDFKTTGELVDAIVRHARGAKG